jgi:CRISPR-associated protein Csb2
MFALAVEFLTGRYVATAFNDRERAEWPPHPARLFSALVATYFDDPRPDERGALEWLERQGPPCLAASAASERELHVTFVPVNDRAGEPNRRVSEPLELRGRQPRTFPSVTPAEPRAMFVWPDAVPTAETVAALDRLAGRVVRLGHSSSLVSVRIFDRPIDVNWQPDDQGHVRLRTVRAGQLRGLEEQFSVHRETEPRVLPAEFRRYTDRPVQVVTFGQESIFSNDWLVLRRVGGTRLPSPSAAGVARIIRKAIMSFAEEPIPESISGHRPDGAPSDRPHLAVVPLPSVGHPHADGAVLGVSLVLPRDIDEGDQRSLFRAIDRWEQTHRREQEETPRLPVHLGAAGTVIVERLDELAEQQGLQPLTWCRSARRWVTATPIALDHNPGDLGSRDPGRLARAIGEAQEAIRASCAHIGLPRPVGVTILPSAPLPGSAKARDFPPYPGSNGRLQRVLTHAAIDFAEPVIGPVLLGAGRYVGLGLMRPVVSHD